MEHFNGLTPAEAERLAILAEEAAEVVQMVGKILRHGYESHHPDETAITNRRLLEKELGDLTASVEMLVAAGDVSALIVGQRAQQKHRCIKQYLHHN